MYVFYIYKLVLVCLDDTCDLCMIIEGDSHVTVRLTVVRAVFAASRDNYIQEWKPSQTQIQPQILRLQDIDSQSRDGRVVADG